MISLRRGGRHRPSASSNMQQRGRKTMERGNALYVEIERVAYALYIRRGMSGRAVQKVFDKAFTSQKGRR